jgi:hypothetical protein
MRASIGSTWCSGPRPSDPSGRPFLRDYLALETVEESSTGQLVDGRAGVAPQIRIRAENQPSTPAASNQPTYLILIRRAVARQSFRTRMAESH